MIVVTNDDGFEARGLATLEAVARELGHVLVVAPCEPCSETGHAVTTNRPLQLNERTADRYSLSGTPADCVRVALNRLAPPGTWVFSGINHGGNLGADVYYSGTVAAAREAALHGYPAISFSCLRHRDRELDWDRAHRWARLVVADLLSRPQTPGSFFNVNFPNLASDATEPEITHCELDHFPLPLGFRQGSEGLSYEGDYYARSWSPGKDVDRCFRGNITVTRIQLGERT